MAVITNLSLGAGVTNYVSDGGGAESGTGSWTLYNDSAAAPVDGTGGSVTLLTLSATTSNPLRGSQSLLLSKTSNAQGHGMATDITIDRADQGRVLTVSFDYQINSGTYADGDITVYLIADPTGTPVIIQPAGYTVMSGVSGVKLKHVATFQTQITGQSYRVCLHVASTSSSSYSLMIDNVSVGPQVIPYGTPTTDWQSFTPTGSWTANTTYLGRWRRVGDSLEVQAKATCSGTPNAAALSFNLPFGLSIDTTKLASTPTTDDTVFGSCIVLDSGVTAYNSGLVVWGTTTSVLATVINAAGTYGAQAGVTNLVPVTFGINDSVSISYRVPIAGWSSNVQMSSDTDTRVVAFEVRGLFAGMDSSTNAKFTSITRQIDTHGAYNSSTGVYTVPVSGWYRVDTNFDTGTGANTFRTYIYKNGSSDTFLGYGTSGGVTLSGNILCNAGDQLSIRSASAMASYSVQCGMSINRISGPSVIAATETVAARYTMSGGNQSIVSGTIVNFNTKKFDTHNAVTTGASWKFTAPVSGKYAFNVSCHSSSGTYNVSFQLYLNTVDTVRQVELVSAGKFSGVSTLDLKAGDIVDIRGNATITITGDERYTFIDIYRMGN